MQPELYLASASPRRRELLTQLGVQFSILRVDVEEQKHHSETPFEYVSRLARDKAVAGVAVSERNLPVIGSDTIVVCDEQVLEKPGDFDDAKRMLSLLSGRTHQVMTAVTIANKEKQQTAVVTTQVTFRELTDSDIEDYWHSGEPQDKAGSYAIQGLGGKFVTYLEGSYYAVVGLPLYETEQLIKQFQA